MKKILLICLLCSLNQLFAQEAAWVYFNAKENVSSSISNPITILTQDAIDRKAQHGIAIDERDVPVNETYISQIKAPVNGVTVLAKSKWFNAVYVLGSEADINALISTFDFVDSVEFADRSLNAQTRVAQIADKFAIENTMANFTYGSTQNQVEMINVDDLHLADYTGNGIVIAVLDSGFNNVESMGAFQRLRDNGKLLDGYDFVDRTSDVYAFADDDHGTRVLSSMAAFIQDQYVGTAPDASYYLFRTEDIYTETPAEEAYWIEAAERSDSIGVHIINTSLGYKDFTNSNYSYSNEDLDGQTAFISRGANIANEKGLLVIASAGNSGASGIGAPADAPGVLTVGAVNATGDYVSFSSQGTAFQPTQKPDVVAQGGGPFLVNDTNAVVSNNGTSFSSPILAGGAATLWQALPNATNEEIKQFILMSSSQFSTPDNLLGHGIPDLQLALNMALSVEEQQDITFSVYPNPVANELVVQKTSEIPISANIYDVLGKKIMQLELTEFQSKIGVSQFKSGIYIINFVTGTSSQTIKFIKS